MCVEGWGADALRVRVTHNREFNGHDWGLEEAVSHEACVTIEQNDVYGMPGFTNRGGKERISSASITNGKITAKVNPMGVMTFCSQDGKELLGENWRRLRDQPSMSLNSEGREFRAVSGETFRAVMRFKAYDGEKIFGMGQYQQKYMDMKGCTLELAHRNSQASVPFMISNRGYGFLWNNPSIGKVTFGKNITEWTAETVRQIDYWIVAGDTPAEIEEKYMAVTGYAPMMPEYGLGFWQCKLRYRTQEEYVPGTG